MKRIKNTSRMSRFTFGTLAIFLTSFVSAKGAKAPEQIPESTLQSITGSYELESGDCEQMPQIDVSTKKHSVIATGLQRYWGRQSTLFDFPKINQGEYRVDYARDFLGRKIKAAMEVRGYATENGLVLNKWIFSTQHTNHGTVDVMTAVSRVEIRASKIFFWSGCADKEGDNYAMDYQIKKLAKPSCVYRKVKR